MTDRVKQPGFRIHFRKPYKPGFAVCLVITPETANGADRYDEPNKLERDIKPWKARKIALELLKYSEACDEAEGSAQPSEKRGAVTVAGA